MYLAHVYTELEYIYSLFEYNQIYTGITITQKMNIQAYNKCAGIRVQWLTQ